MAGEGTTPASMTWKAEHRQAVVASPSSEHSRQKATSSTRAVVGARLFRTVLVAAYACLFASQVLNTHRLHNQTAAAEADGGMLRRGDMRSFAPPSGSESRSAGAIERTAVGGKSPFSVDVLSVASLKRTELLDAQRRTFLTHGSVRNFFNSTEVDE